MQSCDRFSIVGEFGSGVFVYDSEDRSCEFISRTKIQTMNIKRKKCSPCSIYKLKMMYSFEQRGNILEHLLFTYKDDERLYFSILIAKADELSLESNYRRLMELSRLYGYPDDYLIFFNIGSDFVFSKLKDMCMFELHLTRTNYYYSKSYLRELRGIFIPLDMFVYIVELMRSNNKQGVFDAMGIKSFAGVVRFMEDVGDL